MLYLTQGNAALQQCDMEDNYVFQYFKAGYPQKKDYEHHITVVYHYGDDVCGEWTEQCDHRYERHRVLF